LCCNTRPGPRSVLTVFEEFTGNYVSQQEWHSLRDDSFGARNISAAKISTIRKATGCLADTLHMDDDYSAWLTHTLTRSRLTEGAAGQIIALTETHAGNSSPSLGGVRKLRKDSQGMGLAKAMGVLRPELQYFPGKGFLAGMNDMPEGIQDTVRNLSPKLSRAPMTGMWVASSAFAIQQKDNKVVLFSLSPTKQAVLTAASLTFDGGSSFGPASRYTQVSQNDLNLTLLS